ncbi:hypothetical protein V8C26DRAFT_398388 [Trichoderma gracile]
MNRFKRNVLVLLLLTHTSPPIDASPAPRSAYITQSSSADQSSFDMSEERIRPARPAISAVFFPLRDTQLFWSRATEHFCSLILGPLGPRS